MKFIFYKERIKLNRILLAVMIINIAVLIYTFFRVRVGIMLNEPSGIWLDIVLRNGIFYSKVEIVLYVSALLIGVMQFYPEFERKRFRLACHLPVSEYKMIFYTSFFGVMVLTLLWIIDMAGVVFLTSQFFPADIYTAIPLVMFYWFINSLIIYTFASSLTLEASWNVKLRLALMMSGCIGAFKMEVYNSSPLYAVMAFLFAVLYFFSIYFPALRFRKGL